MLFTLPCIKLGNSPRFSTMTSYLIRTHMIFLLVYMIFSSSTKSCDRHMHKSNQVCRLTSTHKFIYIHTYVCIHISICVLLCLPELMCWMELLKAGTAYCSAFLPFAVIACCGAISELGPQSTTANKRMDLLISLDKSKCRKS